jgi:hypothetical protein
VRCLPADFATGIFHFFVDPYGSMKGYFKPKSLKKGCCSNYLCNVIARRSCKERSHCDHGNLMNRIRMKQIASRLAMTKRSYAMTIEPSLRVLRGNLMKRGTHMKQIASLRTFFILFFVLRTFFLVSTCFLNLFFY